MAIAREQPQDQDSHAAGMVSSTYRAAWYERIPTAYWLVGFILLIMPLIASNFVLFQIFGWSFILGMIALSLMFLAGYGGMVSPRSDDHRRARRLHGGDLRRQRH